MSNFVSYYESIVNLDKVSHIMCDSSVINFYSIPISANGDEEPFDSFYFKDEETELEAWELLKTKLGTINLENNIGFQK